MWHPKKNLNPFLPVFSHFFMSYFDVFGSIFEKSAMTDLPKVIVSICLVSYNICMIPHVWTLTFGLNLSGAWGEKYKRCIILPISATGKNGRNCCLSHFMCQGLFKEMELPSSVSFFSVISSSILKISVPILLKISWICLNSPTCLILTQFWAIYGQ